MLRAGLFKAATVFVFSLAAPIASSQEAYPVKPVRIVVPYPPGGATDITARVFGQGLGELLGQQFIIDNKPGAGTNLAAAIVARSAPDGYTFYVASFASHGVNKWLYKSLSYDPDKDFVAAAMMVRSPQFLITSLSLPVNSVQELVRLAKTRKLTYASVGIGSPNHIAGELFRMQSNINVVHVPYKGSAPANVGLLGGEVDFMFDATAMQHVHQGKLKALAVAHTERWPTEPDIPSMAEVGLPGVVVAPFFALVAPTGTPIPILDRINEATRAVAKRPEVAAKLAPISVLPFPLTRQQTADFLREQSTRWAPVVKASGAVVD
jgi:tripartite-type tricarboxylate transporter receptor subunit TctC